MNIVHAITAILFGYLFGCFQTAYFISKKFGKKDIREIGAGNAGASNVTSEMGWKFGILTGICDVLKALIPAKLILLIFPTRHPIIFMKANSSISGPHDDVIIPLNSKKADWEIELGVVIGKEAKNINKENSQDYIFGYCIVNDISEREFQLERSGTWDKGKGCDTFGPVGPYLLTKDEIPDVQNLEMELKVNGKIMQKGNTNKMIFNINHIVYYLSHFMTLFPGDIITTGTPPGVGMGKKPQKFLEEGDEMTLCINKLGFQKQKIVKINR